MSKRYGKEFDKYDSSPAKRAKVENPRGGTVPKPKNQSVARNASEDVWGDDFDDDAIEELDFVASQACSQVSEEYCFSFTEIVIISVQCYLFQDVNVSVDSRAHNDVSKVTRATNNFQPVPLTSRAAGSGLVNRQVLKLKDQSKPTFGNKLADERSYNNAPSQKLASSENITDIADQDRSIAFDDFRTNLLGRGNLNSTFNPRNDVIVSGTLCCSIFVNFGVRQCSTFCFLLSSRDIVVPKKKSTYGSNVGIECIPLNFFFYYTGDARLRHIEKLEQENKKLLNDFQTKEGENAFLRNKLKLTVQRADKERAERERLMEEQASRYRAEINALHKEKDGMKTQHDFQV